MKPRKRKYNPRRARIGQSYTVQDVAELYGLHKNAVFNWIKDGLPTIDQRLPYLIHGGELAEYLRKKQASRKQQCSPDEFFCFKCRIPRKAWENLADIQIRNESKLALSAVCYVCGTAMHRAGSVKKLSEYKKTFSIQTVWDERITVLASPIVNSDMRKDERA